MAAPEQCLGLSDIRYSISDIELRTERIVWGHATGPDYVVVLNRFTEMEHALREEVGLALNEAEAQEFAQAAATLLFHVQEVSGSSLNLHAQKKRCRESSNICQRIF